MTFGQWLDAYEVRGKCLYPNLFDFQEMWSLNAKRFPGFNLVFCWMYLLWLPGALFVTVFCLVEGLGKWWSPKCEPKMFETVTKGQLVELLVRGMLKDGRQNEDMIGLLMKCGSFKGLDEGQLVAVADEMEAVYQRFGERIP